MDFALGGSAKVSAKVSAKKFDGKGRYEPKLGGLRRSKLRAGGHWA